MNDALVIAENQAGIWVMSLNRVAKRNAMNAQMIHALRETLKAGIEDKNIFAILLKAEGEHFCAGADIQWMEETARRSYDENYQDALQLADLMYEWYSCVKPTLALVHGLTLGGGLGLVAGSDMVFASKNARFGFSEVKLGLAPSTISPYVVAAMGEKAARYYFITGERFDAEEAKRVGLVHTVVDDKDLLTKGMALGKKLRENNLAAMISAKKLVREVINEPMTSAITRITAGHLAKLRATDDAQEGMHAFIEKRKPRWQEQE